MREFQQDQGRTSKPQIWKVHRVRSRVFITWGQKDGAMQQTVQTFLPLNVGKANEKSADVVAQEFMDREILRRRRNGYQEIGNTANDLAEAIHYGTKIDFHQPLPRNLRFYKPQHHPSKYLLKLVDEGKVWYIRKRNGNMAPVVIDADGEIHLYSSTTTMFPKKEETPWIGRFPHIASEFAGMPIQPKSLFLGELVASMDVDNLQYVGSVLRALTNQALQTQAEQGELCYCIWDIAYFNGKQLIGKVPLYERYAMLNEFLEGCPNYILMPHVYVAGDDIIGFGNFDGTTRGGINLARHLGWEGFVIADPESTYGDRVMAFHGKAERPKECAKLKPLHSADFIIRWDPDNGIGTWGKGKKSHGVGAVFAYLLNDAGEEVFVSKVGGGLSDKDVARLADPSLYPLIAEIEFASVTPKGSIEFPEFTHDEAGELRIRTDKAYEECTFDQLPIPDEEG